MGAGYKASLRELPRAGTHRELHEVQGSSELAPWRGGAGVQWTPLSRRLRSADRAGRRDPGREALGGSGRQPSSGGTPAGTHRQSSRKKHYT